MEYRINLKFITNIASVSRGLANTLKQGIIKEVAVLKEGLTSIANSLRETQSDIQKIKESIKGVNLTPDKIKEELITSFKNELTSALTFSNAQKGKIRQRLFEAIDSIFKSFTDDFWKIGAKGKGREQSNLEKAVESFRLNIIKTFEHILNLAKTQITIGDIPLLFGPETIKAIIENIRKSVNEAIRQSAKVKIKTPRFTLDLSEVYSKALSEIITKQPFIFTRLIFDFTEKVLKAIQGFILTLITNRLLVVPYSFVVPKNLLNRIIKTIIENTNIVVSDKAKIDGRIVSSLIKRILNELKVMDLKPENLLPTINKFVDKLLNIIAKEVQKILAGKGSILITSPTPPKGSSITETRAIVPLQPEEQRRAELRGEPLAQIRGGAIVPASSIPRIPFDKKAFLDAYLSFMEKITRFFDNLAFRTFILGIGLRDIYFYTRVISDTIARFLSGLISSSEYLLILERRITSLFGGINVGYSLAEEKVKELNILAVKTIFATEELAEAWTQFKVLGIENEKVFRLTLDTATAFGVEVSKIADDIARALEGDATAFKNLRHSIGLTNIKMKEFGGVIDSSGRLILRQEEALRKNQQALINYLQTFEGTAEAVVGTLPQQIKNLQDALRMLSLSITKNMSFLSFLVNITTDALLGLSRTAQEAFSDIGFNIQSLGKIITGVGINAVGNLSILLFGLVKAIEFTTNVLGGLLLTSSTLIFNISSIASNLIMLGKELKITTTDIRVLTLELLNFIRIATGIKETDKAFINLRELVLALTSDISRFNKYVISFLGFLFYLARGIIAIFTTLKGFLTALGIVGVLSLIFYISKVIEERNRKEREATNLYIQAQRQKLQLQREGISLLYTEVSITESLFQKYKKIADIYKDTTNNAEAINNIVKEINNDVDKGIELYLEFNNAIKELRDNLTLSKEAAKELYRNLILSAFPREKLRDVGLRKKIEEEIASAIGDADVRLKDLANTFGQIIDKVIDFEKVNRLNNEIKNLQEELLIVQKEIKEIEERRRGIITLINPIELRYSERLLYLTAERARLEESLNRVIKERKKIISDEQIQALRETQQKLKEIAETIQKIKEEELKGLQKITLELTKQRILEEAVKVEVIPQRILNIATALDSMFKNITEKQERLDTLNKKLKETQEEIDNLTQQIYQNSLKLTELKLKEVNNTEEAKKINIEIENIQSTINEQQKEVNSLIQKKLSLTKEILKTDYEIKNLTQEINKLQRNFNDYIKEGLDKIQALTRAGIDTKNYEEELNFLIKINNLTGKAIDENIVKQAKALGILERMKDEASRVLQYLSLEQIQRMLEEPARMIKELGLTDDYKELIETTKEAGVEIKDLFENFVFYVKTSISLPDLKLKEANRLIDELSQKQFSNTRELEYQASIVENTIKKLGINEVIYNNLNKQIKEIVEKKKEELTQTTLTNEELSKEIDKYIEIVRLAEKLNIDLSKTKLPLNKEAIEEALKDIKARQEELLEETSINVFRAYLEDARRELLAYVQKQLSETTTFREAVNKLRFLIETQKIKLDIDELYDILKEWRKSNKELLSGLKESTKSLISDIDRLIKPDKETPVENITKQARMLIESYRRAGLPTGNLENIVKQLEQYKPPVFKPIGAEEEEITPFQKGLLKELRTGLEVVEREITRQQIEASKNMLEASETFREAVELFNKTITLQQSRPERVLERKDNTLKQFHMPFP